MRRVSLLAIFAGCAGVGATALFYGCSTDTTGDACIDNLVCPATVDGGGGDSPVGVDGGDARGGDGGKDGGGDVVATDAGGDVASDAVVCDVSKVPASGDPCVVSNDLAVFVAPIAAGGSDSADGTMQHPFATLGHALTSHGTKRIYACNATYSEQLTVSAGVSMFGGFGCPGGAGAWVWTTGTRATVSSPSPDFALKVDTVTAAVDVEDMELDSLSNAAAGGSSFAVIVNASTNVSFHRVAMSAGNAGAGTPGGTNANYNQAASGGNSPPAATPDQGARSVTCSCVNGDTSTGARGGSGDNATASAGADGLPALAENPTGLTPKHDGKGGAGAVGANVCVNGDPGADAAQGGAGGAGATGIGALTASGWSNASGTGASGTIGKVAQGGGGGGGGIYVGVATAGGGGGACGGCGGGNAAGGTSGGSSIALVSVSSTVTLDASCTLTAGTGGAGGKGGDAQPGQAGGTGGLQALGGCSGGNGGHGTTGGGGGGGAAGHSIAIAYFGTAVTDNSATKTVRTAATGGAPGSAGSPAATKGVDGLAVAIKQF